MTLQDRRAADSARADAVGRTRRPWSIATPVAATFWLMIGTAQADVPTVVDVAACNQEAQERRQTPSSSPNSRDETGAEAARRAGGSAATVPGSAGRIAPSGDPQLDGMDGEGAKDAAYRAAYRVCMRKKGF